jgi:hypothetical protein
MAGWSMRRDQASNSQQDLGKALQAKNRRVGIEGGLTLVNGFSSWTRSWISARNSLLGCAPCFRHAPLYTVSNDLRAVTVSTETRRLVMQCQKGMRQQVA